MIRVLNYFVGSPPTKMREQGHDSDLQQNHYVTWIIFHFMKFQNGVIVKKNSIFLPFGWHKVDTVTNDVDLLVSPLKT